MNDLAKYFLAIAVIGTGFYTAQQYRRPQRCPMCDAAVTRGATAESASANSQRSSQAGTAEALPVAALTDVDRVPLLGPDRAAAQGKPADAHAGANTISKPPTLRADKPAADSTTTEPGKSPVTDSAKQDIKKETSAKPKPSPRKPDKKTSTARTHAAEQHRAGAGEKARPDTWAAESGNSTWQESTPAMTGSSEWAQNGDAVPPEFAREYEPHFRQNEPYDRVAEQGADRTSTRQTKSKPRADSRPSPATESQSTCQQADAAASRRHRIAEGDTLRRLAEKYLGNPERYLDIFQANSDVLFDPRLIPIGVEIVIPDRTTAVAKAASGPTPAAAAPERDDGSNQGDMWDDFFSIPETSQH